jgi:hypothetical protein
VDESRNPVLRQHVLQGNERPGCEPEWHNTLCFSV